MDQRRLISSGALIAAAMAATSCGVQKDGETAAEPSKMNEKQAIERAEQIIHGQWIDVPQRPSTY